MTPNSILIADNTAVVKLPQPTILAARSPTPFLDLPRGRFGGDASFAFAGRPRWGSGCSVGSSRNARHSKAEGLGHAGHVEKEGKKSDWQRRSAGIEPGDRARAGEAQGRMLSEQSPALRHGPPQERVAPAGS